MEERAKGEKTRQKKGREGREAVPNHGAKKTERRIRGGGGAYKVTRIGSVFPKCINFRS